MRSPDVSDVDRIEAMLRGVPPETERDARLEGLVRQLRAETPAAPAELRLRVRELRPRERRPLSWRPALVLVPVALVLAGLVALGRGDGGGNVDRGAGEAVEGLSYERDAARAPRGRALPPARPLPPAPSAAGALAEPAGGRAQEWDVWLDLVVRDNDELSDASADAIATARDLGGFVVSSSVGTQGRSGEARLVLRVPATRVQDALARLSELGRIAGQRVSIQDRQDELDRLARRLDSLRVSLAEVRAQLARTDLSRAERLRLELRRQRLQGLLNQLTRERGRVTREVALAEVSVALRTEVAGAAAPTPRIERALDLALEALSVAAAALVFLAVFLAPLAAVAALALVARRAWRRRADDRLLDRPRPASARE